MNIALAITPTPIPPLHAISEAQVNANLTYAERQALEAISQAAENNLPCPSNLDLEELTGYNSSSMGPKLVASLEAKGFIKVTQRMQRFRRIKIIATGKFTARAPLQCTRRPHVPRGAGSMAGKLAKKARRL